MSNNDILRTLRYTFDFKDSEMIEIFALAGREVNRSEVINWMKKEDEEDFQALFDKDLAYFLNGLIIKNRGKKDGEIPKAEKSLNNNQIFRKLRIALTYKEDDILEVLSSVGMHISPHELSAFFRNPKQSQYRVCHDQVLRYFLRGLQKKYRGKGHK